MVSKELTVSLIGIDSMTTVIGIKVFPNPAFDVVNVLFDDQSANAGFSISDLAGKPVFSCLIKNGWDSIDISMFSAGTYCWQLVANA
ncbi:MAG: T9SS type A sorting domain-containing protein [Salinivirgaceae bacterium]|nr:T9SS type A sorting domain-containing protein [Salinivirgaceae bacterium]